MIEIIRSCARPQQIEQMLDEYKFYIKLAVDINRRVLAGGGEMHYDSEQVLLEDGSQQKDIWAASFRPDNKNIRCESMVNLRPPQNRSMEILDDRIREEVTKIIMEFLG